jgi:hypothetical protein
MSLKFLRVVPERIIRGRHILFNVLRKPPNVAVKEEFVRGMSIEAFYTPSIYLHLEWVVCCHV